MTDKEYSPSEVPFSIWETAIDRKQENLSRKIQNSLSENKLEQGAEEER
ncbi:hypothetical protein [Mesobacillus campisalis]|nr:hypothetical protein [Mesobacillus campisalis]